MSDPGTARTSVEFRCHSATSRQADINPPDPGASLMSTRPSAHPNRLRPLRGDCARPRRESLCYSVVAPTGDPGSYQSNDGAPGPSACPRQRYGRKAMIDSSRRTVLTTGAAAAATAAAPQVLAQAPQTSAPQG